MEKQKKSKDMEANIDHGVNLDPLNNMSTNILARWRGWNLLQNQSTSILVLYRSGNLDIF